MHDWSKVFAPPHDKIQIGKFTSLNSSIKPGNLRLIQQTKRNLCKTHRQSAQQLLCTSHPSSLLLSLAPSVSKLPSPAATTRLALAPPKPVAPPVAAAEPSPRSPPPTAQTTWERAGAATCAPQTTATVGKCLARVGSLRSSAHPTGRDGVTAISLLMAGVALRVESLRSTKTLTGAASRFNRWRTSRNMDMFLPGLKGSVEAGISTSSMHAIQCKYWF